MRKWAKTARSKDLVIPSLLRNSLLRTRTHSSRAEHRIRTIPRSVTGGPHRRADRVHYVVDSNLSSRGNTSPAETLQLCRTRIAFPPGSGPLYYGPGAARLGAFFVHNPTLELLWNSTVKFHFRDTFAPSPPTSLSAVLAGHNKKRI
jgi:hypothetical protein